MNVWAALAGLRIFVVEDEALVSMLIEQYLEEFGCEVAGVASRLDEALDKARTLAVDAAVLDLNLAGRLSYPVAEILHRRGVPVVYATGYGVAGLPEHLRGHPVVAKPFEREHLAEALLSAAAPGPRQPRPN